MATNKDSAKDGAGKNDDLIRIKGARTHNLKNVSLEIPRNKLVVFTGLSGSGKSSLAFDTIFAEGQRRYVESLSAYARQFLNQMQKPDVDEITGLSPAISIDQKTRSGNPRSTVATITEIYDYMRVLYARIGKPYCLECGRRIEKLSNEEIIAFVKEKISKSKNAKSVRLYAPVVRGRKGEYYQLLYDLLDKGYSEVLVDGHRKKLREQILLDRNKKHDIDVLVDEIALTDFLYKSAPARAGVKKDEKKKAVGQALEKSIRDSANERLAEAVEKALNEADGLIRVTFDSSGSAGASFVSGPRKGSPDHEKNFASATVAGDENGTIMSARFSCPYDGFSFPEIEPRLFSFNSPYGACPVCHGLGTKHLFGGGVCDECGGARLRKEALNVRVGDNSAETFGKKSDFKVAPKSDFDEKVSAPKKAAGFNIVELTALSIAEAKDFFHDLKLSDKEKTISNAVVKEIESRIKFLHDVGLTYMSLDRRANTLSGGEAQRIRLASQLGSRLVGTLYVLDEPTIGLHSRDNDRLIKTLKDLRDLGNSIIVVEHDEDTIYSSDYLVDIGPGAGVHGGKIIVSDWTDHLLTAKKNTFDSLTVDYLRGERSIEMPEKRRSEDKGTLRIRGGNVFNIKDLNVDIPLGRMVAITGVSGSGKSSLVYELLYENLQRRYERKYRTNKLANCKEFTGTEYLSRTVLIDQSPIGRTPRSNPATYTGAFTWIRDLFASTEIARVRGWKANRFSFNVKGGRCEACQGNGTIAVEMHFLPTVYVECDVCRGKRFQKDTLEVKYKGKNIDDVLHMTVEEALKFFGEIPAIYDRLKTLSEVGLGYLELGQSATTLSGGEAQRVKISSELYRPMTEKTIYILDEPTVGLHYEDVRHLIVILQKLVEKNNSVVVIEHNMDVIKNADYLIDMGPEGGDGGGQIVAKGTPEDVANNKNSYTGEYLKKILNKK